MRLGIRYLGLFAVSLALTSCGGVEEVGPAEAKPLTEQEKQKIEKEVQQSKKKMMEMMEQMKKKQAR